MSPAAAAAGAAGALLINHIITGPHWIDNCQHLAEEHDTAHALLMGIPISSHALLSASSAHPALFRLEEHIFSLSLLVAPKFGP